MTTSGLTPVYCQIYTGLLVGKLQVQRGVSLKSFVPVYGLSNHTVNVIEVPLLHSVGGNLEGRGRRRRRRGKVGGEGNSPSLWRNGKNGNKSGSLRSLSYVHTHMHS